jgi:hypothetical protein
MWLKELVDICEPIEIDLDEKSAASDAFSASGCEAASLTRTSASPDGLIVRESE